MRIGFVQSASPWSLCQADARAGAKPQTVGTDPERLHQSLNARDEVCALSRVAHRPCDQQHSRQIWYLLALLTILWLGVQMVAGQGAINFNNRVPAEPIYRVEAPVVDAVSGMRASGTDYLAQLYVGPADRQEEDLKSVDYPPVTFRTGPAGGFVKVDGDSTRIIPDMPLGTRVVAQIRAWTAASGTTFEEAVTAARRTQAGEHRYGGSSLVHTVLGGLPPQSSPADLLGLREIIYLRPAPYLVEAVKGAKHLRLSWPAADTNYVLEATAALASTNWSIVAELPAIESGMQVVTQDVAGVQRFYRLRRQ